MGQQRKRRKRRSGFRKPDAVIATLTSLTIILLLVWGGLYWKESSERALLTHSNGEEQVEQAMQEDGGAQTKDSEELNSELDKQPSAIGETVVPAEQTNDNPGIAGKVPQLTEAPAESTQETVVKPNTQRTVKPQSNSPTETSSPSTNQTEPPINQAEKYKQEIIQVQAMCTKDMKEVLSGAESSIQQLDKKDPIAVQAWKVQLEKELAAAESKCDGKFQEVIQNAEKNSISPKVIAEWKQTFSALKEKIQGESRAKLLQLMRG